MERKAEVALVLARRQPGAGPTPLPQEDDRSTYLGDGCIAESLDHEGEAGSRGRRCHAGTGICGSDGHLDAGDLVFGLNHEQVLVALQALEVDALIRPRAE